MWSESSSWKNHWIKDLHSMILRLDQKTISKYSCYLVRNTLYSTWSSALSQAYIHSSLWVVTFLSWISDMSGAPEHSRWTSLLLVLHSLLTESLLGDWTMCLSLRCMIKFCSKSCWKALGVSKHWCRNCKSSAEDSWCASRRQWLRL